MRTAECQVGEACDSQYQLYFDMRDAKSLRSYVGTSDYHERRQRLATYFERQLRTDIGERFGEDESPPFIYKIRDGKLYSPERDEPFEESILRGIGRKQIDLERDLAEYEGFVSVIQGYLADPKTPDGSMAVSPSPKGLPGSDYTQNYLDVAMKVGDLVILKRYKSNLTNEEYRQKLIEINPYAQFLIPENPTDMDFKRNPITVPHDLGFATVEQIRQFFMRDRIGVPKEKVDEAFKAIAPLVVSHINTIIENPEALDEAKVGYKAIQKGAVIAYECGHTSFENMTKKEVADLSRENVKVGAGGCGSCSTSEQGLEKGDDYGKLSFNCPSCGEINVRKPNEFVVKCQNNKCRDPYKVLPPGMMFSVKGL